MSPDERQLRRQCSSFCRYLTGREGSEYVQSKYLQAVAGDPRLRLQDGEPSWRLDLASRSAVWASLVDGYSAWFDRVSPFRRRLVLLVAILETAPPPSHLPDAHAGGALRAGFSLGLDGAAALIRLPVSCLALPLARALGLHRRGRR